MRALLHHAVQSWMHWMWVTGRRARTFCSNVSMHNRSSWENITNLWWGNHRLKRHVAGLMNSYLTRYFDPKNRSVRSDENQKGHLRGTAILSILSNTAGLIPPFWNVLDSIFKFFSLIFLYMCMQNVFITLNNFSSGIIKVQSYLIQGFVRACGYRDRII